MERLVLAWRLTKGTNFQPTGPLTPGDSTKVYGDMSRDLRILLAVLAVCGLASVACSLSGNGGVVPPTPLSSPSTFITPIPLTQTNPTPLVVTATLMPTATTFSFATAVLPAPATS